MKAAVVGILSGLILVASAGAHGLLGWSPFEEALESAKVDGEVVAALSIGWYFGSASMLGFGVIVLHQATRLLRGRPVQSGPVSTISVLYLVFGAAAYVYRDFNAHFLLFVATGLLVGLFGFLATRIDASDHAA